MLPSSLWSGIRNIFIGSPQFSGESTFTILPEPIPMPVSKWNLLLLKAAL